MKPHLQLKDAKKVLLLDKIGKKIMIWVYHDDFFLHIHEYLSLKIDRIDSVLRISQVTEDHDASLYPSTDDMAFVLA